MIVEHERDLEEILYLKNTSVDTLHITVVLGIKFIGLESYNTFFILYLLI